MQDKSQVVDQLAWREFEYNEIYAGIQNAQGLLDCTGDILWGLADRWQGLKASARGRCREDLTDLHISNLLLAVRGLADQAGRIRSAIASQHQLAIPHDCKANGAEDLVA